jgi:hypothetical protein
MARRWREFTSWNCEACGAENIIVECDDREAHDATIFERLCTTCGAPAAGKTVQPEGVRYRITTRSQFYPKRQFHPASRSL